MSLHRSAGRARSEREKTQWPGAIEPMDVYRAEREPGLWDQLCFCAMRGPDEGDLFALEGACKRYRGLHMTSSASAGKDYPHQRPVSFLFGRRRLL
jgi:hypothetical protein